MILRPTKKYLIYFGYNGSKFPEMAKGSTGYGVMDFVRQTITDSLFGLPPHRHPIFDQVRISPSSRTDRGVHAIRNALALWYVPEHKCHLDDTPELRQHYIDDWNRRMQLAKPNSLTIEDFHEVSPGFCTRIHVQMRRYVYRIAVARSQEIYEAMRTEPSTVCFSERDYAWFLPPGLDLYKMQKACELFHGTHVVGSFFLHRDRDKRKEQRRGEYVKAIRYIEHCGVSKGEAYAFDNDLYDYYNVSVYSRSFVREQIRRMMGAIIAHGYDRIPLSLIKWLLANPISDNFWGLRLRVAPPYGLHLVDVSYDPVDFVNPNPYVDNKVIVVGEDGTMKERLEKNLDAEKEERELDENDEEDGDGDELLENDRRIVGSSQR
ncbi:hypothetical protein WR25_13289 isoform A [Diploscapter pachys]|uniref:tRNA pseudouridine synthase n=2 Tax=Diploscapter pachys TaxID=2018661 RepID=A0A2A2JRG2_9BILA|nr:hypothetical protein WR25_13289 isoform A [Diploscapter pachys]